MLRLLLQAISKLAFDFERRKLAIEEVRELIYREILEYHPQVLQDYLSGGRLPTFLYPSAVDNFKRQFIHLEGGGEQRGAGVPGGRYLGLRQGPQLVLRQVGLC